MLYNFLSPQPTRDKVAVTYSGLKDLPKATKIVFTCFPFVFITIGACLEEFVISAITTFGPKLLEVQFYVPAGRSALLYGVVAIPVALFGNMLGTYIKGVTQEPITRSLRTYHNVESTLSYIVLFLEM